eukprot:458060_1
MASFLQVYVAVLTLVCYLIYIPFGVFFITKYILRRNNIILRKRYGTIAIYQNIWLLIMIFSGMTIPCYFKDVSIIHFHLFYLFVVSGYGLLYSLLTRLWAYFYDIKYDQIVNEHSWSYMLNGSNNTQDAMYDAIDQSNCFLKYKFVGNTKIVSKICVFFWFISCLVVLFLLPPWDYSRNQDTTSNKYQIWLVINMTLCLILTAFPIIAIITIVCKTPKFYDHLFIRQEFKLILTLCAVFWSIAILALIFLLIIESVTVINFVGTTVWFLICTVFFIMVLVSTRVVLKSVKIYLEYDDNKNNSEQNVSQRFTLDKVLKDTVLFHEFVSHLRHEFSVENILAFYEMIYFRQYISDCYSNQIKQTNDIVWQFSEQLSKPKTTYKTNENDEMIIVSYDELKDIAYYLFTQYIQNGTELEINLPHSMNHGFHLLMHNYEDWKNKTEQEISVNDLYILYTDTIIELYRLLRHSFHRFNPSNLKKAFSHISLSCTNLSQSPSV